MCYSPALPAGPGTRISLSEKEAGIEVEGTVREELAGGNYRVELDNKHTVLAYASGKMRKTADRPRTTRRRIAMMIQRGIRGTII